MAISRSQMGKQLRGSPQKKRGIPSTGSDERDVQAVRDYQTRMAPNRSFVAKMKEGGKSRVNEAGNYTKPSLRKRLFNEIKAGGKGGKPGQWSARKAQMLAQRYKKSGGGYKD